MGGKNFNYVPLVCIETSCQKFGVKVYNVELDMCSSCGNELYPEYDSSVTNQLDDSEFLERFLNEGGAQQPMGRRVELIDGVKITTLKPKKEDEEVFTCAPDLDNCPIAPKAKVKIPLDLYNKWIFLAVQINTEWIAYLKGRVDQNDANVYIIESMYFPDQLASGAHCEAKDGQIEEGTIAAVHSHVGMGVFFSQEDRKHFNHSIELVVNNKGEIKGMGRVKLECGKYMRADVNIVFTDCGAELALQEELQKKIEPEKTVYTVQSFPTGNHQGKNNSNGGWKGRKWKDGRWVDENDQPALPMGTD